MFCFIVTRLSSQNPFIENKGQLPEQVKAQLHLKSGSLFFEKDKQTICVPFYPDNNQTLFKLTSDFFMKKKIGISSQSINCPHPNRLVENDKKSLFSARVIAT